MINIVEQILYKLQNYIIIKKVFKVMRHNILNIRAILRDSKIRINGNNNKITIEQGSFKRLKVSIDGDNNILKINTNLTVRNLEIIIQGNNHIVTLGENTNIGGANIVCCGESSTISIGSGCLLASNIEFRSGDEHKILQNNQVINRSKNIIISDNVWIGQNVNILKDVHIGSGSIVGMSSLVTSGKFKKNVIIAGIPAKIIKENIKWEE